MQFTSRYIEYLRSDEWKKKSALIRRIDNYTCQICRFDARHDIGGRPDHGHLEVHHLTYKRLYHEWTIDLVTLCKGCHSDITNIKNVEQISRDGALDIVCARFNVEPSEFRTRLTIRSEKHAALIETERFFTPKPVKIKKQKKRKKPKQRKEKKNLETRIYAVVGLTRNGIYYGDKSSKRAASNNRFGRRKRCKTEHEAQAWIKERMKQLRQKDMPKSQPSKHRPIPIIPVSNSFGCLNLANEGQRLVING